MSASTEFIAHVTDQFALIPSLTTGKFFGGHAFKSRGVQFAMVMGNTLYLCVDAHTRPLYEQRGSKPFSYATSKGRVEVRKYFSAPEELFDNDTDLLIWARQAIEAASQA